MRTGMLLGIASVVLIGFVCQASFSAGPAATAKAIERLQSQDAKVRTTAVDDLLAERQATIASLIGLIQDKSPDSRWLMWDSGENLAIKALGELKAEEAVPVLVKWATPPATGFKTVSGQISPSNSPAAQAIEKIGKPAEPALLDALRLKPEKPIWEISLGILKKIEGPKCAAIILEDAIAKEAADAPAKEHLQAALKKLKEVK